MHHITPHGTQAQTQPGRTHAMRAREAADESWGNGATYDCGGGRATAKVWGRGACSALSPQYASVVNSATARLIQCAEKVSQYLEKAPLHGSLLGTSTISTKLVEWPVVERVPARVVVL